MFFKTTSISYFSLNFLIYCICPLTLLSLSYLSKQIKLTLVDMYILHSKLTKVNLLMIISLSIFCCQLTLIIDNTKLISFFLLCNFLFDSCYYVFLKRDVFDRLLSIRLVSLIYRDRQLVCTFQLVLILFC